MLPYSNVFKFTLALYCSFISTEATWIFTWSWESGNTGANNNNNNNNNNNCRVSGAETSATSEQFSNPQTCRLPNVCYGEKRLIIWWKKSQIWTATKTLQEIWALDFNFFSEGDNGFSEWTTMVTEWWKMIWCVSKCNTTSLQRRKHATNHVTVQTGCRWSHGESWHVWIWLFFFLWTCKNLIYQFWAQTGWKYRTTHTRMHTHTRTLLLWSRAKAGS